MVMDLWKLWYRIEHKFCTKIEKEPHIEIISVYTIGFGLIECLYIGNFIDQYKEEDTLFY